jgi:hypothetical protein
VDTVASAVIMVSYLCLQDCNSSNTEYTEIIKCLVELSSSTNHPPADYDSESLLNYQVVLEALQGELADFQKDHVAAWTVFSRNVAQKDSTLQVDY